MFDFASFALLTILLVVFGWLTTRAWGASNGFVKWAGSILSGLITLVIIVILLGGIAGIFRATQTYDNPVAEVTVDLSPEQIARGERLANLCTGCHAEDKALPLEGANMMADSPLPIGPLYAPNLTPVHLADWTDGEIIRAIREGVKPNGRSILFMPSVSFRHLSDEDVEALVAYLRSQPELLPASPPNRITILGAIMMNFFPFFSVQDPIDGPVTAPPEGPTAEYGQYLVMATGCQDCHGEDLSGTGLDGTFSANLTAILPAWTEDEFITFMRTGTRPDGSQVSEGMPWKEYDKFAMDDDLRAYYAYLSGLSPVENSGE